MTGSAEISQPSFLPGSIIQRRLKSRWIPGAKHVGIYISDEQVIHFNGEQVSGREFFVVSQTLEEFADGEPVTVRDCAIDEQHSAAVVAEALLRHHELENGFNGDYHFVWNNCQDFAVHCYQVAFPCSRNPGRTRREKASRTQRAKFGRKVAKAVGRGAVVVAGSLLLARRRRGRA